MIEPRRRVLLALGLSAAALLLQELVQALALGRAPFLFFVPAIVAAGVYGGTWPAILVALVGAITGGIAIQNASVPLLVRSDPASWSFVTFLTVGSVLVFLAHRLYSAASSRQQAADALAATQVELRQQLADLSELHELTGRLESTPDLRGQLAAVLRSSARLLGSERGLVSLRSPGGERLLMEAEIGLTALARERLENVAFGAELIGLPCHGRQRVHIVDIETDMRAEPFREFARSEGFRSVQVTPLLDRHNEVLGCIAVLIDEARELTAREARLADLCAHKATIAVERTLAERLAREHDRRFRSVLDGSAAGFAVFRPIFDDAGNIRDFLWVYINPVAAAVWQRKPEEFIGQPVSVSLPGAVVSAPPFDRFIAVLRDEVGQEFEHESRLTVTREWFHVIASPLDGDVAVWFTNVSARRRNEAALVEADQRKDEFLATLAHELRNPLAPIRQATQIAMSAQATDTQKRWSYSVIERQVHHMSLLLDDLLDISRITRGKLRLRRQTCELHDVFNAGVEAARPLIDRKEHTLDLDLPAGQVYLDADPLRLAQVLANLLTNAAKYTNAGGRIRVSARTEATELVIEVTDNGIGIESSELTGIFTMFSQLSTAHERSEGGLGIGLALTRGLVQLHGGTIEATSEGAGQGARFTARLPILTPVQPTGGAIEAPSGPAATQCARRRLVIADDNRDAAESLAMLMRLNGHEVHLAHDGRAAVEAIDRTQPDAALLDIGMPELSGHDVAREVRANPAHAGILLIAITGWGQAADKATALAAGFDVHLTKPVDTARLTALLAERPVRLTADAV